MIASLECGYEQGLIKGEKFCFRYLDFYFQHGESTSTASQLSKEINKVPLLLQNLGFTQSLVKGAKLCLNPYFFGWLEK